ncbi:antitoxin [uncultured Enterovirga sp.]|uniref:antitoxin n=1 Tax=uncultured Enterovirga sp. TaxID=2026352 RepID=UPI0035C9E797
MPVTRVFQSGNSRAVRLPKGFQLPLGEVEISRRGDEIVLRERTSNVQDAVDAMRELARLIELPEDRPPQPIEPW